MKLIYKILLVNMKKLGDLMQLKVDISNKTIFRIFAVALVFLLAIYFVMEARTALILIFVSFFLAIALNPVVTYLSRLMPRKSRGLATALTYIGVLAVLGFLISTLLPPIAGQTGQLIDSFPGYIEQLQESDGTIGSIVNYYDSGEGGDSLQQELSDRFSGASEPVLAFMGRIFSNVVSTLTVLVVTFFMLVEGPRWIKKFWDLTPKNHRKHRQNLAAKMYRIITAYVNGQLLIATINGLVTFIVLSIVGIPYALSLAAISALLGLIPVIGTTLGAVIIIGVGFFESLTAAIILAIYFVIYQQVENNVIQPAIQSRSLGMSPLLILISVILGFSLAGILGGLLAIPIMGCLRILILDYISEHHLTNV
ncbi:MAG: AI-2E family transporter [Candidatus Saccharimonadales bacterium]